MSRITAPELLVTALTESDTPLRVSELMHRTGLTKSTASVSLMRLVQAGTVVRLARGAYVITGNEAAPVLPPLSDEALKYRYSPSTMQVLELLKATGVPMSTKEIIAITGMPRSRVNMIVQRLVERDHAVRVGWGAYLAL